MFHRDDTNVNVSIVDPHGYHLKDTLPKPLGLAQFTAAHGDDFHRVESIARMKDGTLRVLALTLDSVREAVRIAKDAEALYLQEANARRSFTRASRLREWATCGAQTLRSTTK